MTRLKYLGAAALLAAAVATPAMAQPVIQEPDVYAQNHPWANGYDYRYRRSGFWPADVAAGVVAGAIGAADAIVTAPYRDSYAYYGSPSYDDSSTYYIERPLSRRPACGIQPGATYMGPDGRWYPC
jgi:hypothetical protein